MEKDHGKKSYEKRKGKGVLEDTKSMTFKGEK